MARPTKQGVDYFPLDVHIDNKFKFIEIKYGLEGFAVVIKLMQEVYSQGYYCDWGEDEQLLFSDETKLDVDKLNEIVNESLKREIFNENMFNDYKILTSRGIQKRYKEIVRRRKDVDVTPEYLLIDNSFGVNDGIKSTSSSQDDNKSTQRKGKESKQKKSKEEDHLSQIKDLLHSYKDVEEFNETNKRYWDVIRETRKRGNVAESVISNNMKKWSKYNPIIVDYALKEHIKNHKTKREEYTLGIMRGTTLEEVNKPKEVKKPKVRKQIEIEPVMEKWGI